VRVLQRGYSELDLLYFYFTRQVQQLIRSKALKEASVAEVYSEFIAKQIQELQIHMKQVPSYKSFNEWYLKKNGYPFSIHELNGEAVAPLINGKLFTQRLSGVIGLIRDRFTATVIAEMLNKFDKVLVVYGGSHWAPQRKIFNHWFVDSNGIVSEKFTTTPYSH
jgi:hypothetical protein